MEASGISAVEQAVSDAVRTIGSIRTELSDVNLLLLQLDALVREVDLAAINVWDLITCSHLNLTLYACRRLRRRASPSTAPPRSTNCSAPRMH